MATTTRNAISTLPLKTKLALSPPSDPSLFTYRTRTPIMSASSSSSSPSLSSSRKPVTFDVPGTDRSEQERVRDKTFERYASGRNPKRNGKGTAIVWFRNDLRVVDNEALYRAWISSEAVLPVYCVDPRLFRSTHYFGFPKTGALRAQFLMESVDDLKNNLMKKGLNLLIRHGKPEDVLPSLADAFAAHTADNLDILPRIQVFAHKETCSEEMEVEGSVRTALGRLQVPGYQNPKLQLLWGSTLYHIDDLPFDPTNLPDVYTQFRKSVETKCAVRGCFKLPKSLGPLPDVKDWGTFPSMDQLGLFPLEIAKGMRFLGGETAALGRLNDYFWNKDLLKVYKETRNGMLGPDYSTKFSPWLASGSISPRFIYEEVKRYEGEREANDSTYWVLFELIWRDYFRFISIKYGNSLFHKGGPRNVERKWTQDQKLFEFWRDGNTGYPLIDANMKELSATGFMSNRGRQIVCSFLVRDMGVDWRMGAEWFETCLLDYDPASNYGNWTYGAGVGNDPREDRYFSIPKQAQTYDPEGEYVAYWLPQLQKLPKEKRNSPGASYIEPIVPLKHGSLGRQHGKERMPAFRQNRRQVKAGGASRSFN